MKKVLPLLLIFSLASEIVLIAAVRGRQVKYVGGTITTIPENTEGKLTLEERSALFTPKKGTRIEIPYDTIGSLEYGQKAGRRVGVAIAVSPLFLFSKKRKHYFTIGWRDESGANQGAVFELAKGIVRETLSAFEAKTGKQVEYESDEARKHAEKQ